MCHKAVVVSLYNYGIDNNTMISNSEYIHLCLNSIGQLTPRTSYVPTNIIYTAVLSMKEHHVQCKSHESLSLGVCSYVCHL